MRSLDQFVCEAGTAIDGPALQNSWTEFVSPFGVESYHVVSASLQVKKQSSSPIGITYNNPPGWREYYRERGYHRYDSLVAKGLVYRGLFTSDEALAEYRSPEAERVIREALEFGVPGGVIATSMSLEPGTMIAACLYLPAECLKMDTATKLALQTASYVFCARLKEFTATPEALEFQPLTPRELDVLRWVALGRTKREIADYLCVSVSCVKRHCENASLKLGVNNMASAVARAMAHELLIF